MKRPNCALFMSFTILSFLASSPVRADMLYQFINHNGQNGYTLSGTIGVKDNLHTPGELTNQDVNSLSLTISDPSSHVVDTFSAADILTLASVSIDSNHIYLSQPPNPVTFEAFWIFSQDLSSTLVYTLDNAPFLSLFDTEYRATAPGVPGILFNNTIEKGLNPQPDFTIADAVSTSSPEPTSIVMLLTFLGCVGLLRCRRKRGGQPAAELG